MKKILTSCAFAMFGMFGSFALVPVAVHAQYYQPTAGPEQLTFAGVVMGTAGGSMVVRSEQGDVTVALHPSTMMATTTGYPVPYTSFVPGQQVQVTGVVADGVFIATQILLVEQIVAPTLAQPYSANSFFVEPFITGPIIIRDNFFPRNVFPRDHRFRHHRDVREGHALTTPHLREDIRHDRSRLQNTTDSVSHRKIKHDTGSDRRVLERRHK